jgi:Rrf2 family nitric oxide-sensitive transcriptional repressor
MRLTIYTDYCLRVLIYVATHPEKPATIAGIARSYGISENHLVKVVHFLGKEGFLHNVRGRGGGLRLARPAKDIRVGDVVRCAEGPPVLAACFDAAAMPCSIYPACRLRNMLSDAADAFHRELDRHTLADLVGAPRQVAQLRILFGSPATARPRTDARTP